MGDKESFPGQPRGPFELEDFRERAAIEAASSVGDLDQCIIDLDARTFDPQRSPKQWAEQFDRIMRDDVGERWTPARWFVFSERLHDLVSQ